MLVLRVLVSGQAPDFANTPMATGVGVTDIASTLLLHILSSLSN